MWLGEPLKMGEQILGYKETKVGEAEVVKAREKLYVARITQT